MYLRMKLTLTRSFKSGELEDGIWQFFTGKIALSWGKLHFFKLLITWLLNPRDYPANPPRR